jgi:hypothetical protein
MPYELSESYHVLHYGSGEYYHGHYDWFDVDPDVGVAGSPFALTHVELAESDCRSAWQQSIRHCARLSKQYCEFEWWWNCVPVDW